MTYGERLKQASLRLANHSWLLSDDCDNEAEEAVAMQAEAIREALVQAGYDKQSIDIHLKQNGYIPGKGEQNEL